MPLLWDNLAKQLESVRAGGGFDYSAWASPAAAPIQGSRDERLKMALNAIQDSGNTQMIESLNAALEGREASFDLPPIESGPQAFLKTLNQKAFQATRL